MAAGEPQSGQEQACFGDQPQQQQHFRRAQRQGRQGAEAEAAGHGIGQTRTHEIQRHRCVADQQVAQADPQHPLRAIPLDQEKRRNAHHLEGHVQADQIAHHEAGVESPQQHRRQQGRTAAWIAPLVEPHRHHHQGVQQQKPGADRVELQHHSVVPQQHQGAHIAIDQAVGTDQASGQATQQQGDFPKGRQQGTEKGHQIRRQQPADQHRWGEQGVHCSKLRTSSTGSKRARRLITTSSRACIERPITIAVRITA